MLGIEVLDPFRVESEDPRARGLGLIDAITSLGRQKITRQATARVADAATGVLPPWGTSFNPTFQGYEIHMGETRLQHNCSPFLSLLRAGDDAAVEDGAITEDGRIIGTYLHGLFDSMEGRFWLLNHLRRLCDKEEIPVTDDHNTVVEDRYDRLALHFRRHLRLDVINEAIGIAK